MAKAKVKRGVSRPRKVPPRRVRSDDYVDEADGKEYRPHAGQWVDFRGKSTVESVIIGLRLQTLLRLSGLSDEEAAETSGLYERVTEELARGIAAWNWTDDDGNDLPSPPSAKDIRALSVAELFWLLGARYGSRTKEAAKNA